MKIPQVFCIEVEHSPGNLATVLAEVGKAGLTVEGLETISRTEDRTLWELTLDMEVGQHDTLTRALASLPIVSVLGISDRVFDRHEGGKIHTQPKAPISSVRMLRDVYTPGVARVCLKIQEEPEAAARYTNIARSVAIVTNGTAILGLGNIGAVAGMPVMEGKAALFHQLADLSGIPILIEDLDADRIVETTAAIAPTFGAIQLEDIRAPECFEIERKLQERLSIPVLHDDQHGTAVVTLAALLNGTARAGRDLSSLVVGQIGLGAAGIGIGSLLSGMGVKELLGSDLNQDARARFEGLGGKTGTLEELMARADVVIATTGVPGLIKPEMVREGQMIFALSNPDPEICPHLARELGAAFAADGRNINNVLGFPGLFRGALEAGARRFTTEMLLAAARTIAECADGDALVPNPLERKVHNRVSEAVKEAALASDA